MTIPEDNLEHDKAIRRMQQMGDLQINRQNRVTWGFGYRGSDLLTACQRIVDYHTKRVAFWKDELAKAESKVSSASVVLHKQKVTGGERAEVVLDPTITRRLNECQSKITAHQATIREFAIWREAFQAAGDQMYHLKPDDIQYFRLHDPELGDDGEEDSDE